MNSLSNWINDEIIEVIIPKNYVKNKIVWKNSQSFIKIFTEQLIVNFSIVLYRDRTKSIRSKHFQLASRKPQLNHDIRMRVKEAQSLTWCPQLNVQFLNWLSECLWRTVVPLIGNRNCPIHIVRQMQLTMMKHMMRPESNVSSVIPRRCNAIYSLSRRAAVDCNHQCNHKIFYRKKFWNSFHIFQINRRCFSRKKCTENAFLAFKEFIVLSQSFVPFITVLDHHSSWLSNFSNILRRKCKNNLQPALNIKIIQLRFE